MKKILGILLAAAAMFAFGAVYWMTPLTRSFLDKPADDKSAGGQLSAQFSESGTYFVPGETDADKRAALFENGPVAMVHIKVGGSSEMDPKRMGIGFVHELLSMAFAAAIMGPLLGELNTYTRRVVFMLCIGALMGFYSSLSNAIWWFNALDFSMVVGVHTMLAWGVGGLVLAGFIKPNSVKPG